jgi:hypothetical protein
MKHKLIVENDNEENCLRPPKELWTNQRKHEIELISKNSNGIYL